MQKITLKDTRGNQFQWFKSDEEADICIEYTLASGKYGLPDEIEITQTEMSTEQIAAWQYLLDTDWYTCRKVDSGEDIPEIVQTARQDARSVL